MALVEYYGTGRRKTSTARVHIRPGSGAITVNRRVDIVVLSTASAEANALLPGLEAAHQKESRHE